MCDICGGRVGAAKAMEARGARDTVRLLAVDGRRAGSGERAARQQGSRWRRGQPVVDLPCVDNRRLRVYATTGSASRTTGSDPDRSGGRKRRRWN